MQTPVIAGITRLAAGKFLELQELEYHDRKGKVHRWEAAQRIRSAGAVVLIPKLEPSGKYIMIRQFRPPVGKYVIEFPAGLIDPGESIEDTACRELYEETGYQGTVVRIIPPCCSSPGMTGEHFATALLSIDETAYPRPPAQHLEGTEDIEVLLLSPEEAQIYVNSARKRGDAIDGKVGFFLAVQSL